MGWHKGSLSPGTGFEYGVHTPENVAFNINGNPGFIICDEGAFSILSMHVNNAWKPDSVLNFIGIKNSGETVLLDVNLGPISNNTLLNEDDFNDFSDLQSLSVQIVNEDDIAVFDDMILDITSPCNMPEFDSIRHDYSPIFPT